MAEALWTKRRKAFLVASFIGVFIVYYTVADFFPAKSSISYDEDHYVSKFLLMKSKKVAPIKTSEYTSSPSDNNYEPLNLDKTNFDMSTLEPNLTIRILKAGDTTTLEVNYSKSAERVVNRKVFVEMRDINKSTQNIFFIESRCTTEKMAVNFAGNKGFILNARQCCAIESTAQMNLDHDVYIFHSCSLEDDFFQYSPKFVQKLFYYPNINLIRLNTTEIFMDTPLEELHRKKLLETSYYPVEHTSDLIRLVLLWRFGGTYFDLDVVTIRSLNDLKTNWAGMQDESTIGNGVLSFDTEGVGHTMLQHALEYANVHYDPSQWSSNGPELITRFILQECKVKQVVDTLKDCKGSFTVFHTSVLYPIHYSHAEYFFDQKLGKEVCSLIKSKKSYSVHLWNKLSHDLKVTVGSTQGYALLADEYCPRVYRHCGSYF